MSVNKVILVGNVGRDPEMKYFDNDVAKANFSLATSERGYTTSGGTQVPERTEWHNIVCWRGLAQVAEKFVKKGTLVYVEGKIRSRSYDDQNGVKRYITEIVADNLELLGRRGGSDEGFGNRENENGQNHAASSGSALSDEQDEISDADDLPF
ncbi:single-strand binding protein [Porphyromonadaceae bacterium NLAE-zl-C104]|jgi:single-strand DNA-binding protein|uniref:single-stranded DNA-binding protein n=1 Tax=Proteiniphilum TaxID=294702 RepID=UPI0008955B27|nr:MULTISPECIES: single-stranded DNA-binding protein [Proteiniphilum]MDY9918043.1 single-stranded DNA-binding protein [Proteiniphilum sp.]SDZ93812.1 single-strand binding protein [Porphyromonadaceae bacterium KH3R12]SFS62693.1 single-strand binding protein [Porphyromonadaceae bacterium NLAE-zl-C104]